VIALPRSITSTRLTTKQILAVAAAELLGVVLGAGAFGCVLVGEGLLSPPP
jgi:hypothetical protein